MSPERTVAVLGASGLVGAALCQEWRDRYALTAPAHAQLDVLDFPALHDFVHESSAQTVVNVVAWADVDGAEREAGDTSGVVYRLNVKLPGQLAEQCAANGKHLVHISTDYVFDGTKTEAPYVESDPTRAVAWYAETKRLGEQAVRAADANACIARIEMPFTGREHRKRDLARTLATLLAQGKSIQGVTDQRITPVFLDDAAQALARLVDSRYAGVIHVAAADWTTPYEFACRIARALELPTELIKPESFERFSTTRPAARPQHSWLDVSHFTALFGGGMLRSVDDEVAAWAVQWRSS